MNFSEMIFLRISFKKPNQKQIKNKCSTYEKQKTPFLASCFETGKATIKQINPGKDDCVKISGGFTIVSTDNDNRHIT